MWYYNRPYAYIAHHGILGQKWGVRRYQNQDGTLTPEGKSRLDKLRNRELGYLERRKNNTQYLLSQKQRETQEKQLQNVIDYLKSMSHEDLSKIKRYTLLGQEVLDTITNEGSDVRVNNDFFNDILLTALEKKSHLH